MEDTFLQAIQKQIEAKCAEIGDEIFERAQAELRTKVRELAIRVAAEVQQIVRVNVFHDRMEYIIYFEKPKP